MTTKSNNEQGTDEYSIKEVCALLGLSMVYVRRMIQKGKLQTRQIIIAKDTYKHLISKQTIEEWRKSTSSHSKREDDRNKFTLYATSAELEMIKDLLETNKIESVIKRTNKAKVTN